MSRHILDLVTVVWWAHDLFGHRRKQFQKMAGKIDHYAVLGVVFGASPDEIKKAHKKMALKCLPPPRLPLFPLL